MVGGTARAENFVRGNPNLDDTIQRLVAYQEAGADVLYATTFAMFGSSPMLPKSEVIGEYVQRCLERPAYARAQEKDG